MWLAILFFNSQCQETPKSPRMRDLSKPLLKSCRYIKALQQNDWLGFLHTAYWATPAYISCSISLKICLLCNFLLQVTKVTGECVDYLNLLYRNSTSHRAALFPSTAATFAIRPVCMFAARHKNITPGWMDHALQYSCLRLCSSLCTFLTFLTQLLCKASIEHWIGKAHNTVLLCIHVLLTSRVRKAQSEEQSCLPQAVS